MFPRLSKIFTLINSLFILGWYFQLLMYKLLEGLRRRDSSCRVNHILMYIYNSNHLKKKKKNHLDNYIIKNIVDTTDLNSLKKYIIDIIDLNSLKKYYKGYRTHHNYWNAKSCATKLVPKTPNKPHLYEMC